jgi:hypothetical protein
MLVSLTVLAPDSANQHTELSSGVDGLQ